jgi:hypothetical protein
MQPISAPSDEHIAARTRRKWGERCGGESIVAAAIPSIYGTPPPSVLPKITINF